MLPAEKLDDISSDLVNKIDFEPNGFLLKKFGREKVNELQKIVKAQPRNDVAYILLGTAFSYLDKKEEVIKNFEIAKRLNPFNLVTHKNYWVALNIVADVELVIAEVYKSLDFFLNGKKKISKEDIRFLLEHGLSTLGDLLAKEGKEDDFFSYIENLKKQELYKTFFSKEFEENLRENVLIGRNKLSSMRMFLSSHSNYTYSDSFLDLRIYAPELAGAEGIVFFKAILKKKSPLAIDIDKRLAYEDYICDLLEKNFDSEVLDKMVFGTEVENGR